MRHHSQQSHHGHHGRHASGISTSLACALLACLAMLAGCRDKHEPLKPTVSSGAGVATAQR